jgi:NAD(P)-dependent dehydrogenase (short-subunit alcohol dehydrogenase family)
MSRTVLITGGGSGIGAATARAFAAEGDTVFVYDISQERAEEVASSLDGRGHARTLDVADEAAVNAAVAEAQKETGRIDVLVNSAGVGDGAPQIVDTDTALWQRVTDIIMTGTFYASRAAARFMVEQGAGRIVMISSVSALSGRSNGVAYSASKGALEGLTRRLAVELGPHGVTVNSILPGAISTGISANMQEVLGDLFPPRRSAEDVEEIVEEMLTKWIPQGRVGTPEEVAGAVLYFASEAAAYTNGASLAVDGGWLAR